MTGPADASSRLRWAITKDARRMGIEVSIAEARWTPWASVTFSGARHTMTLALPDTEPATRWLNALPETELAVSGHLVADLVVGDGARTEGAITVSVEALTVES